MAPNGASVRKALSDVNKNDGMSFGSLFADLEEFAKSEVKEKVKTGLPTIEKPGNWDSKVNNGHEAKENRGRSTSPPVNKIPSNLAKSFPNGKIMGDKPDILRCTHCKRPVLKHAMPTHIERCLNKKQEKQRKKKEAKDARDAAARKERGQDSDDDDDSAKKTATKTGLTASKKRKAADEGDDTGPKKKKKKDDAKSKLPKLKAPVDVERQCGVELPQGGQCARSLTCKSHSMGAKRAVPGRSAPYDKLLMEYQRKNQAKLQKAAFDANAPDPDDGSLPSGPVDSEEEKDAVMSAILRSWGGTPLYHTTRVPLRKKYEYNRIKGMLGSALGGRGGSGLFGTGIVGKGIFGGGPVVGAPSIDADGVIHGKKGAVVPGARSMTAPSRKASVVTSS